MLHSVWLFHYHDFQGLYICSEVTDMFDYFDALMTTIDCDPCISLEKGKADEFGRCIWQPDKEL